MAIHETDNFHTGRATAVRVVKYACALSAATVRMVFSGGVLDLCNRAKTPQMF